MENTHTEMKQLVESVVDDMVLSDYNIRLNLVLRLNSEEREDQVSLVMQDETNQVFSLLYPFTGVKVRLSEQDAEPTSAKGYVSAHLIKVFNVLSEFNGKSILRIGDTEDVTRFYKNLGKLAHRAAFQAWPEVDGVLDSTAELSTVVTDTRTTYTIDVFFVYTLNGQYAFDNVVKWADKLLSQRDKFTLPFRFTVAVPLDDMNLLMPTVGKDLLSAGFCYGCVGQDGVAIPSERTTAMRLLGKAGDSPHPCGLFTYSV